MNDDQLHDRFAAAGRAADAPDGAAADSSVDALWATARRRRRNRRALGAASVAAVLLVAGVAVAVVPDRDGGGSERVASRSASEEAACQAIHRVLVPAVDTPSTPPGSFTLDRSITIAPTSLATLVDDFDPRLHASLDPDVDEAAAERLADEVADEAGVLAVDVVSRAEGYAEFRRLFADQPAMLGSITEDQIPLNLLVEVALTSRSTVVDALKRDERVAEVRDGAASIGVALSAAVYLEQQGMGSVLPELALDLRAVGEPWADDLVAAITRASPGEGLADGEAVVLDDAAIARVVDGVTATSAICPVPPPGLDGEPSGGRSGAGSNAAGEALACTAVTRSVFPGTTGPGDAPTTLARLLDDFDLRAIRVDVDKSADADAEAAFFAALASRPGVTIISTTPRAESRANLDGVVDDPEGGEIADQIAQGSAWVEVEREDQDAFVAWVDAQPGEHGVTRPDEDTTYVTGWLAAATSGGDPTKVASMEASQDELRRSGLVWAADLASLIDEAATHDGPIGVDPGRLQRIAEGADAAEACGS